MQGELMDRDQELHAAATLPAELMLVRMEGEHIMTMATQRRVPLAQVIQEAMALLEACPEAAHQAVYSKPTGLEADRCRSCKHERQRKSWERFHEKCPECGRQMLEGKMKFARGLSIRAAESLSNLVGYNRLATDATPVDGKDGIWRVTAVFVDYGRGVIRSDSDLVSQYRQKKGGGVYKVDDERFLETVVKAAKAKVARNAVMKSIPFELRQAYEQKAMDVAPKTLTPEKIAAIVQAFNNRGVTPTDLNHLLRREKTDKWTAADAETLRGVWTALENGEMTTDELLEQCQPPEPLTEEPSQQSTDAETLPAEPEPPAAAKRRTRSAPTVPPTPAAESAPEATPTAVVPAGDAITAELLGQPQAAPPAASPAASATTTAPPPRPTPAATKKPANPPANATAASPAPSQSATPTARTPTMQGPVGTAPATPPAAHPAGPVGTPLVQSPKMSVAGCESYIRTKFGEDSNGFDLEAIARRAIGQPNPIAFMDQIIRRINPNWENFRLPEGPTDEEIAAQIAAQGEPQFEPDPIPADESQDSTVAIPDCVRDPFKRPQSFSVVAAAAERKLREYQQVKRIQDYMEKNVRPSEAFTNEEAAYLLDLGARCVWNLEHPDRAVNLD